MARTLVRVIDSHTAGEPTRVVVNGGPDLGKGSVADRLGVFRARHDDFRRAVIGEPRGSDAMVGGLLLEPADPAHAAGVIFFNNVGTLGMCGHGTMGLLVTLEHLGRLKPGRHRIETPVGLVTAALGEKGEVSLENVPSFRYRKEVRVSLGSLGSVTGDVAWGGNWFFISQDHGQELSLKNARNLSDYAMAVRQALVREGVTGAGGREVDHVELVGPPSRAPAALWEPVPSHSAATDSPSIAPSLGSDLRSIVPSSGSDSPSVILSSGSGLPSVGLPSIARSSGSGLPSVVPSSGSGLRSVTPSSGGGLPSVADQASSPPRRVGGLFLGAGSARQLARRATRLAVNRQQNAPHHVANVVRRRVTTTMT